jgi:hypothetical protein
LSISHRPHHALELRGVEDDLKLRHRVRAHLLAAEPAELDREICQ